MKKILVATALLSLCSTAAFALTIQDSKHDLSSTGSSVFKSNAQKQICIFCHTPHNAVKNVPLWNRTGNSATFRLYTSSSTLTDATSGSTLYPDSLSLFCLSCHDGDSAQMAQNVVNYGSETDKTMTGTFKTTANLGGAGGNLTNDHPIGFSYGSAASMDSGALVLAPLFGGKSPFFKANAGAISDSMECSSCHAVHDNAYAPFLRASNDGSALCLTCHNK